MFFLTPISLRLLQTMIYASYSVLIIIQLVLIKILFSSGRITNSSSKKKEKRKKKAWPRTTMQFKKLGRSLLLRKKKAKNKLGTSNNVFHTRTVRESSRENHLGMQYSHSFDKSAGL